MSQIDDFQVIVRAWALERLSRIERAFETKGGWETWAQVDLALYTRGISAERSKITDIQLGREQDVFIKDGRSTGERADFVLTSGGRQHIIELKVDLSNGTAASTLASRFKTDVEKAKKQMDAKFVNAEVYAIAIGSNQMACDEVKAQIQGTTDKAKKSRYTEFTLSPKKVWSFIWKK